MVRGTADPPRGDLLPVPLLPGGPNSGVPGLLPQVRWAVNRVVMCTVVRIVHMFLL